MADAFSSASLRIASSYSDITNLIDSLTKNQHFIKKRDEQLLNLEVLSIFTMSNKILQHATLETSISPHIIEVPYPQITLFRNQIDSLNIELDRITRNFDTSIEISHQIYQKKLNDISDEYRNRLSTLINKYSYEEEELNSQINDIERNFESRLQAETSIHMQDRNDIYTKLVKLQNEYDLMHSTLSSSLSASEMRIDMLEKQRQMLIETNQNVTATIELKLQQQLEAMKSQYSITIDSLETENKNLRDQIKYSDELFNLEYDKLKNQLQGIEKEMEEKLEGLMSDQLLLYEKRKRKMQSKYQKTVSEIRSQIEAEKISSSNQIQLLSAQIEQKKKIIAEADKRYEENAALIAKKADLMIEEKQNEMTITTKIHKQAINHLKQKYALQIEKETHDAAKKRAALEAKLNQTQREGEVLQNKLQLEINAITRVNEKVADLKILEETNIASNLNSDTNLNANSNPNENSDQSKINAKKINEKYQKLYKKRNNGTRKLSQYKSLIADVQPIGLANNPKLSIEIRNRLNYFAESNKMELSIISKALEHINDQSLADLLLAKLKVDEAKRKHSFLENEKNKMAEKVRDSQVILDSLNSRKIFLDNDEQSKLNQKIVDQHSKIVQMKSEIQKIKEGQLTAKITIENVIEEQQNEINQLKQKLDKLKKEKEQNQNNIMLKYQNMLSEDTKIADSIISDLHTKAENALSKLNLIDGKCKQESIDNHQKWLGIRKEMADSNNKLNNVLQNDRQNLQSPIRLRSAPMKSQPLPILKK